MPIANARGSSSSSRSSVPDRWTLALALLLTQQTSSGAADALTPSTTPSAAPPPPPCTGDSNGAYNDSMTFTAFPAPNLVPWPLKIELEDGYFNLNTSTV